MNRLAEPLSDKDMKSWLPSAKLYTYPEFAQLVKNGSSLESILGQGKTAILLYEVQPGQGHWTALFERPNNVVECFDSLGYIPDDELHFIPKSYRTISNQDHSWLLRLLYHSNKSIEYNDRQLQKDEPGIATCGRHCIFRIAFRELPLERFYKLFDGINPDTFVSEFISNKPFA